MDKIVFILFEENIDESEKEIIGVYSEFETAKAKAVESARKHGIEREYEWAVTTTDFWCYEIEQHGVIR